MSNEIQLTEEEKAEILAKREEARKEAERLANIKQTVYNENLEEAIKSAKKDLEDSVKKNLEKVALYERTFKQFQKLSPDYKLVKETFYYEEPVKVLKMEFIDDEGNEIHKDENGEYISSWDRKETVKTLKKKGTRCSIEYTGKQPKREGYESKYHIEAVIQMRGEYDWNKKPFDRVHVKGYGVPSSEERKYLTPKTAHEKLIYFIEREFAKIERETKAESLKERALADLKETYINSEVEETHVGRRFNTDAYKVKLHNGVEITLTAIEDEDNNISYSIHSIDYLYNVTPESVIGALAKIQPEQD